MRENTLTACLGRSIGVCRIGIDNKFTILKQYEYDECYSLCEIRKEEGLFAFCGLDNGVRICKIDEK